MYNIRADDTLPIFLAVLEGKSDNVDRFRVPDLVDRPRIGYGKAVGIAIGLGDRDGGFADAKVLSASLVGVAVHDIQVSDRKSKEERVIRL